MGTNKSVRLDCFHDPVWDKMDREGAVTEHMIAESFLVARDFYIPAIEAVVGCVFLFLLWRILFSKGDKPSNEMGLQASIIGQ